MTGLTPIDWHQIGLVLGVPAVIAAASGLYLAIEQVLLAVEGWRHRQLLRRAGRALVRRPGI